VGGLGGAAVCADTAQPLWGGSRAVLV
jgi:hypothetical protein